MINTFIILALLACIPGAVYYLTATLIRNTAVASRMNLALGRSPSSQAAGRLSAGAADFTLKLGSVLSILGSLMPLGEKDRRKIAANVRRVGFKTTNAVTVVLGIKFACLLIGLVAGTALLAPGLPGAAGILAGLVGGLMFGVVLNILPEVLLGRLASRRLRRIEAGLAETYDLLVVCLESGLTFDRALRRTLGNLRTFQPDLAKELGQVMLDISVHGRTREEALNRLAERLDSQSFRDLAITVAQSERHGTPLADSLRKLAGSVRVDTISRMQARMVRLPTLLVIPSVICLLPGIMVIVGGPAFVRLTSSLANFGGG